jgi:hypothetical protein
MLPRMMKIQRSAMVDEPQFSMPQQQIDVARGSVDIADESVEPDDG